MAVALVKMSVAARGENANGYLKMKIFFFATVALGSPLWTNQ